jgi:hypothetical protein
MLAQTEPGAFLRSGSPNGVSANRAGSISSTTPMLARARRKRRKPVGSLCVVAASSSTVLGPSASASATPSRTAAQSTFPRK